MTEDVVVRPATPRDLEAVARLAAELVGHHRALDPGRFDWIEIDERRERVELACALGDARAIVLVAARGDAILGYTYGRVIVDHGGSAMCGELIDLYVCEAERRRGVATRLARELLARFAELGVPRLVLLTAVESAGARRLFDKLGFRPAMIEMLREITPADRRT